MGKNIIPLFVAVTGTIFPCFLAGAIVGAFYFSTFWYWMIGISVISLPWLLLNRVHVRLYHGSINGKSFLDNLKYGYSSTDYYPRHSLFGTSWWSWYWSFFRRHF